jgi:cytochrome P450
VEFLADRTLSGLPGPRPLPLIGNGHRFLGQEAHLVVEEWCKQYGRVFRISFAGKRVLVVADPEAAGAVLRDRPGGFRRSPLIESSFRELGIHGVFSAEGEEWRRQRKLSVTALNSHRLAGGYGLIRTATERLRQRLGAVAEAGEPIEIQRLLTSYTIDITTALAFGIDLNTLERHDVELQRHIQFVFERVGERVFSPIPWWKLGQLSPRERQLRRSLAVLGEAVRGFVATARRRLDEEPGLRDAPENFIQSMLVAQQEDGDGALDDEEVIGNVFTLLFAGEDTTAHSMAWALWFLSTRDEEQRRWAAEARAVLGAEPVPDSTERLKGLEYGIAVLRETIRLKPVAAALISEALAPTRICEVTVETGDWVMLPIRELNVQAAGPDFDPDRWLEPDRAPDQREFFSFGAGPRFCPGRNLALMEGGAAMAMMAHEFEFALDESGGPVEEQLGFVMAPRNLRLVVSRRAGQSSVALT